MKHKNMTTLFILIGLTIIAAITWYSFYKSTFVALSYNDAMDYASIGRNIIEGRGVLSSYITPLGLTHKGLPHPDLWRAPGWPVVLALFIKLFGATDQAIALASGLFYVAAVPFIFLLARYWSGNIVAVVASFIYIFSAQNLHYSLSGLTEPMALFMMVLTVYIMAIPQFRNKWGDILLGLTLGMFYLTRYNALVFILPVIIYWWFKRDESRMASTLRFLGAFVATIFPWLWRNYKLMGSPLFSLQKYEPVMFTETYPGYSLYTMLEKVDVTKFLISNQDQLWRKVVQNWHDFVSGVLNPEFTGISVLLFLIFLLSLIIKFDKKQRGVRLFISACFALQLAALIIIHYIPRLFFMFMPFYIIYGLWMVAKVSDVSFRRQSVTAIVILAMGTLAVSANLPDWNKKNVSEALNKNYVESIKEVAYKTTREDLILSNDGHILAWYLDRNAAKLPYSTGMLKQLDKITPIKMIYLSGRMSWNIPEADDSWRKVFWGKPQELYQFRLWKKFDDGSLIYIRR